MSPALQSARRATAWVLPALLAAMVAAAVLQPLRSYDLGWHLATGRLMLERGAIPSTDPYSFTRPGVPWLDHEWLFQLAAYGLYRLGGWRALLGLDLLLLLGAALVLASWLKAEGVGPPGTAILLALAFSGARFRIDARPETVSLCFLVFLLGLLHSSRREESRRLVWLLPPLMLIWANTHPGVLLGAALMLTWMAVEWGEALIRRGAPPGARQRTAACLISLPLLLANPGGWRLLAVPQEIRRIVLSGHAPNLEWASPGLRQFPLFFLSVGAAALVVAVCRKRLDPPAVLAAALVALLAFQHLRNIGFFFLLLPLALARPVADLEGRLRVPAREGRWVAAALLALLAAHFVRGDLVAGEGGYLKALEPRRVVSFMDSRGIGRRLFNDVLFGGALIWERFPRHRVFIDGRNEVYDTLLAEIFEAVNSGEKWKELLDRYGIDAALLRRGQMQRVVYPPASPGQPSETELRAFSAAHFPEADWALVDWDDHALLYVRRSDPAASPLLGGEFRVNPDDLPHTLALLARGKLSRSVVLDELDRKIREDPGCLSARRLREILARAPTPSTKGP